MTTIRHNIINDAKVEALLTALQTKPSDVFDCRDRIATLEFELSTFKDVENAKEIIAMIEAEIDFEVANETEDIEVPGKKDEPPTIKQIKKYTNADQRAAASLALKSKNHGFIKAKNELVAAERAKAELVMSLQKAKNQLAYHVDMQNALGHVADVVSGLCHESIGAARTEAISKVSALLGGVADELKSAAKEIEGTNVH